VYACIAFIKKLVVLRKRNENHFFRISAFEKYFVDLMMSVLLILKTGSKLERCRINQKSYVSSNFTMVMLPDG